MPPQTVRRYQRERRPARCWPWRPDLPLSRIPAGRVLRLDLPEAAILQFTRDAWQTRGEVATRDTGIGLHVAEIPTAGMATPGSIVFTWRAAATDIWQGRNYEVLVLA